MESESKILVLGGHGMVGAAVIRKLREYGYSDIVAPSIHDLDLTRQTMVETFFRENNFKYVFLFAAKVGGIQANLSAPADFLRINLEIQTNVMNSAYINGVKKLLFLGSSYVYPKDSIQPIKEEYLLTGLLEPSNEGYALAKLVGLKMCEYYKRQFGADFISCMSVNLYGPGDNFNAQNAHVIPSLIAKFHHAKVNGQPVVDVWGTGKTRREFLFVDDLAEACVFLMQNYTEEQTINVGTGEDTTIAELTEIIKEVVGYTGTIFFDISKPDSTLKRILDVSKVHKLGWKHQTALKQGIELTYKAFLGNSKS